MSPRVDVARVKGPGLMVFSAVTFAVMNYYVKLSTGILPGSEVAFVRFAFGLFMTLLLVLASGVARKLGALRGEGVVLSLGRWKMLVGRGLLGGVAIMLLYLALEYGSLTNVTALNYSYAVFATVFGIAILGERPGRMAWWALASSMVGVIMMVGKLGDSFEMRLGDVLALASAVVSGLAVVTVRQLRKTESTWSVFGSLCLFGCIVCALYGWKDFVAIPSHALRWTMGAAVTGFLAQVTMTTGYRYVTASVGSILALSTVLFSALFGYVAMGDRLSPLEAFGALIILAGSCLVSGVDASDASDKPDRSDISHSEHSTLEGSE